jgi:LPXTG-motif cell wall-anchored protein
MGRRYATTMTALTALLVGIFSAAPAAAQDSPEQECLVALQAQTQPLSAAQLEALGDFFDDPGDQTLQSFMRDLLGDPDLSLEGLDPLVCTIYITNVLPDDGGVDDGDDDGIAADDAGDDDGIAADDAGDDDGIAADDAGDDDGIIADDGERTTPSRVLGSAQRRTLPITGFDVLWLTVLGATILGLGYVAVRRSRDQAP